MKTKTHISRLINIEQGEAKLITLPILYSFFAGSAFAFFTTIATALLLTAEDFERQYIPISFVAAGLLVFALGKVFALLQKKLSFNANLRTALAFLLITISVFPPVLKWHGKHILLVFIIYSWIRVFAYIHALTFWGFMAKLLNIQQAKRLFGLISGGEVVGGSIGFLSVPLLVGLTETENLIFIPVFLLLTAFVLLYFITKNTKLKGIKKKAVSKKVEHQNESKFSDKRYYKLFFLIAFIPIFAQMFIDFLFQIQSKAEFPKNEALTAFLGIFFGITTIVEFLLKSLLSGKLLNKYGVKFGLLIFPVVTAAVVFPATALGGIYGTGTLFFTFITLARLFARSVRTSFNDPATQILYQPLPEDQRMRFQNKIESGPKAFGGIVAGIIISILALIQDINLVIFTLFLSAVVAFWIKIAYETYKEYKKELKKVLDLEASLSQESKYTQIYRILGTKVSEAANGAVDKIRHLMHMLYPYKTKHTSGESHIAFRDITEMSRSTNPKERAIAASRLHRYKIYKTEKIFTRLIKDTEPIVASNAVIAAGYSGHSSFFPIIAEKIFDPELKHTALATVFYLKDAITDELAGYFKKSERFPKLQKELIDVFENSNTEKSKEFLIRNINHPNYEVQNKIIRALGKLKITLSGKRSALTDDLLHQNINSFVYQCAALYDLRKFDAAEPLISALKFAKKEKKQQIYNTLAVIYDGHTVNLISKYLDSPKPDSRSFALEIANTVFNDPHKELLLPIMEGISNAETVRHYRYDFPHTSMGIEDRIADIIQCEFRLAGIYTKAQAINLISKYPNNYTETILKSNIVHPNIIIKEITILKYNELFPEKLGDEIQKYITRHPELKLLRSNILRLSDKMYFLHFEILELLRNFNVFKCLDPDELVEFTLSTVQEHHPANQEFYAETNRFFYVLITGELLYNNKTLEGGSMISFLNYNSGIPLKSTLPSILLKSHNSNYYDMVRRHVDFAENLEIQ